ncbi:MAG: NAD(P)H-dependent oxidoreductase [Desulfosalsimonas sp.]
MYILGLQGSPRLKGNTNFLLDAFFQELEGRGAVTEKIHAARVNVEPCTGCGYCEKKGVCAISDDDMSNRIYFLLRRADAVVLASPVYFYNFPARIKAVIDRTQTLWSRKYKLGMQDPGRSRRRGFMLSVGATKGKNLFDGMSLTSRYFFDAVGAEFTGSLTYRRIEEAGELEKQPGVSADAAEAAKHLDPLFSRKKILFACRENACRSQMASGFAAYLAGDSIEALNAGSTPADSVNPVMREVMAEKGIDMGYRRPRSIEDAVEESKPDMIVTMGCGEQCPYIPGVSYIDWDLPDPSGQDIDFMRRVRDEIEQRVRRLIEDQE